MASLLLVVLLCLPGSATSWSAASSPAGAAGFSRHGASWRAFSPSCRAAPGWQERCIDAPKACLAPQPVPRVGSGRSRRVPSLPTPGGACRLRGLGGAGKSGGGEWQRAGWALKCVPGSAGKEEGGPENLSVLPDNLSVVLVGWLGCKPPILEKYSSLYAAAGISTESVIPSIPSMLLAHQGFRGRGSSLVREVCASIKERAGRGERVTVHLFSNNGFVFLSACLLHDPSLRTAISGVILDSCPSYTTPDVAATGLLSALRGVDAPEAASGFRWNAVKAVLSPWLERLDTRQRDAWQVWEDAFPLAPHLFLLSEKDAIVSAADVRAFIDTLEQRLHAHGLRAETVAWEEGAHCAMLRQDPEGYSRAILAFCRSLQS